MSKIMDNKSNESWIAKKLLDTLDAGHYAISLSSIRVR